MTFSFCYFQGFAPEWVQLQKDIREGKEKIKKEMREFRQRLGPSPLNKDSFDKWSDYCDRIEREDVRTVNKMIEKFNLIVPNMNNQMFPYNFQKDKVNIYSTGFDPTVQVAKQNLTTPVQTKNDENSNSIFSGLFSFLNR